MLDRDSRAAAQLRTIDLETGEQEERDDAERRQELDGQVDGGNPRFTARAPVTRLVTATGIR